MISSTQREALSVLAEVLELSPDVRLGQLFAHLGFLGEDQTGRSLGNIDDEQLLSVLYHHHGELLARLANNKPIQNGSTVPVSGNPEVSEPASTAE
jgi:hypothetical protein